MLTELIIPSILLFFLSTGVAYTVIWIMIATPIQQLFTDKPGLRKVHQRIVPRAGGICIVVSFIALMYFWQFGPLQQFHLKPYLYQSLLVASVCIFIVGIIDDTRFFHIENKAKFLLEVLIAVQSVVFFGIQFTRFEIFGNMVDLGMLAIPLSLLWMVGVSNAVNIIDGIDGLAGSITLTSFFTLGLLNLTHNDTALFLLFIILCGLVTGFLFHNFSPARVFLGDTGSLFLGTVLGILTIEAVSVPRGRFTGFLALFVLGFPLVDLSAAMMRRFIKAKVKGKSLIQSLRSMTVADNDHIHHRLVFRGLSHAQATVLLFCFHAGLCAAGITIALRKTKYSHEWVDLIIFGYVIIYLIWFLYKLRFLDYLLLPFKNSTKPDTHMKNQHSVAIINSDAILEHSLKCYKQSDMSFQFVTTDQFLSLETDISLLIINSTDTSTYFDGINSTDFKYPVIFLYENPVNMKRAAMLEVEKNVLHLKKPIYVPVLLKAAFTMIRRQRLKENSILSKTRAFTQKDVLALIRRKKETF
ncbi:MAG: undecaprenyl/decaprenyl-phosphate alpha-N-acetylglucosaminyl 1-phosphate transferase [Chitinispirillaceae bacterium]|nr:undecaprenyl/decaprenyl-phosphate alpha-N-acetylglucosaminyl 1-phosphate transferase [Chitinispirillaceae bacterium]